LASQVNAESDAFFGLASESWISKNQWLRINIMNLENKMASRELAESQARYGFATFV
jgi:hypothetical protein